jgi:hypothetical protein
MIAAERGFVDGTGGRRIVAMFQDAAAARAAGAALRALRAHDWPQGAGWMGTIIQVRLSVLFGFFAHVVTD